MAPSAADDFSLPHISDNDLKPFFVLHKASTRQQRVKKPVGRTCRNVKANLSSSFTASHETEVVGDGLHAKLRMKNFHNAWVKIESTIKYVLHNINADVFNEIDCWVHRSFDAICSSGKPDTNKATCSYPIVTDVTAKQLFTALVVMNNMEFVDDLQTFADLGVHLQFHGCHVANLSSVDFSAKNGIGGCLRSLTRQILKDSIDAADISILASWYMEQENFKCPVVVIIEDMDRCNGPVLSDFILMLSEWVIKIPIILILGVATTLDAPKSILSSKAVQHLSPFKFFLGSPADRLDAIIEAVLVKPCSGFLVGHKVAAFIRNCFLRHDGTLTSLVRAVKMAIVQHFLMEPLSFTVKGLFDEEVTQSWEPTSLAEAWPKQALDLPSCMRRSAEPKSEAWLGGASKMKELLNLWSRVVLSVVHLVKICLDKPEKYHLCNDLEETIVTQGDDCTVSSGVCSLVFSSIGATPTNLLFVGNAPAVKIAISGEILMLKLLQDLPPCSIGRCLYDAGKNQKTTLLDLYYEALDPKLYNLRHSEYLELQPDSQRPSWYHGMHGRSSRMHKGGLIGHTIRQVRDLPPAALYQLIEKWVKQTDGVNEIHEKVKELQSQEKVEDDNLREPASRARRQTIRNIGNLDRGTKALNEKAAALISCMARDHMQPIECIPFHEIVCFKNVDKLQAALFGDPRRRIQRDLLECHSFLKCSCCSKSCNVPMSSMHDTTLMYTLAQEHGDLINLHDWYQSFRAIIFQRTVKERHRSKLSPSPKKRKITTEPQNITEASVQARFCRAVTELQITGLLRMPSKRRPDYVQRVAFGL